MLPDNVQDILDKGRKAKAELPMVQEAVLELRKDVIEKLMRIDTKDDQGRKNLVESLQIGKEVVEYLILTINKAEHVKNKLDNIQKIGKKTNFFGRTVP